MSPAPAFGRPGRLPGQAPPVWRSRRENELFVGRDDELERVWDGLCRHGHLAVVPEGDLSDVGETELAAEYQHRYKLRYDVAWWVDCSPGHDIAGQLAQLADQARARLAECATDVATDVAPEPGEGWLLIFAGVDSPEDVEPYLPGGGAHCLIVADRTVDSWRDRTVPIGPLQRSESVMLLTSAAPMVDPATAAGFGELFGHRPALLAELAGYLIRETRVTPELCQRLFEMAVARPGAPAAVEAPPGSSNGPVPAVGGDPRAKGDPPGEATPTAPRGDVSGSPAQAAEGAIAVAGGGGALEQPAGAREVDALVAALMQVEYIADVVGFEHWQAELARLSGRTVVLTSRWLAVRLTTLVTEAVREPGPGMLDALVQSLELVAPRDDRAVAVVRRLVSEQATGRVGGLELFADPASQVSASAYRFDSWPLVDGAVSSAPPPPTRGPAGADAYYFFTSHAHRHDRDRVVAFHRELEAELRRKARRRVEPAGFLDAERMGGGEHWSFSETRHG